MGLQSMGVKPPNMLAVAKTLYCTAVKLSALLSRTVLHAHLMKSFTGVKTPHCTVYLYTVQFTRILWHNCCENGLEPPQTHVSRTIPGRETRASAVRHETDVGRI